MCLVSEVSLRSLQEGISCCVTNFLTSRGICPKREENDNYYLTFPTCDHLDTNHRVKGISLL